MRHSFVYGALCALGVMAAAIPANAAPCSGDSSISVGIYGSGSGISSLTCSVVDNKITIGETWVSGAVGLIQFDGLLDGVNYTIEKVITNSSLIDFISISNELLDPTSLNPDGTSADDSFDALDLNPPLLFVPDGFGSSNELDGLSFAQVANVGDPELVERTSTAFDTIISDELAKRDFLNFTEGTGIGAGETASIFFGLRDSNGIGDTDCTGEGDLSGCINAGFLLAQRLNFEVTPPPIPEPGTLLIFGLGLAGLGALRKRKTIIA